MSRKTEAEEPTYPDLFVGFAETRSLKDNSSTQVVTIVSEEPFSGGIRYVPAGQGATEHVLIRDDDGHWYVVPADKEDEAGKYFEDLASYEADMADDRVQYRPREPEEPEWLIRVGGAPSRVRFTGYEVL